MLNKSLEFAAVHLLDSLALNLFFSAVEVLLEGGGTWKINIQVSVVSSSTKQPLPPLPSPSIYCDQNVIPRVRGIRVTNDIPAG